MRKSRRIGTVVVAAALAAALSGSVALAQSAPAAQQGKKRTRHMWFERAKIQQALELTEKQVNELTALQETYRTHLLELRKAQRKAYTEVIEALGEAKPDAAKVAAARKALEEAALALDRAIMDHWENMRSILTEAQWKKLPEVAPRALRFGGGMALRGHGKIRVGGAGKVETKTR